MAKDQPARLCFDRIVPDDLNPARAAAEQAVAESALRTMRTPLPDIDALDVSHPVMRLGIVTVKQWPNGSTLKCRFLDGTPKQRKRVEEKAHIWEEFANVKFKFVKSSDADIRISFQADPGSWSALGTDALVRSFFPTHLPTMNYGWLEDDTDDKEYERVVVHEFGHALGAIHEHQTPSTGLNWNTAEVYREFSGPPNFWSKEDIDHNVLQRYSHTQVNATAYDPKSIMLYSFPGSLFTDGKGTDQNDHLSAADKEFIASVYPSR